MPEDFESKYLREIALVDDMKAEIEDIKKQINALDSKYNELSPMIKQLSLLNNSLLETQRELARFMIFSYASHYHNIVQKQKPEASSQFFNQMTSDASAARTAVKTSEEPFVVYYEFIDKCKNKLKELKITFVDI